MSSRANAIDLDGDADMQSSPPPAAASSAAVAPSSNGSVNKFARPSTTASNYSHSPFAFDTKTAKNFDKQYAAIYFTRLQHLKPIVLEQAKLTLDATMSDAPNAAAAAASASSSSLSSTAPKVCTRVLDIVPDTLCIISGTVYKDMKLKPCILEEYNKEKGVATVSATTMDGAKYISPDDQLILEDEFGRITLTGSAEKLPIASLVSGIVIAVLGREIAGGKFEVDQVFYPEMAPQKPMPRIPAQSAPAYMLCVSGLNFGTPGSDPMPIQLLIDYITGLLGDAAEQSSSARIARVLIAGNSLHRFTKAKKNKDFGRDEVDSNEVAAALKELDLLLTQLTAAIPVDILPGDQDPSNFTLPQQPFHKCLFPSSSTYSTFTSTTNPTWLEVNQLQVLATSGQNVNDLEKYSDAPHTVDFLENCMRWRNVAPTAPDTLGCYPYQHKDPFVLDESPHIYVVGNQAQYETRLLKGQKGEQIRLVSLPSFLATGTAVLIDLNSPTLETHEMTFKVGI